MRERLEQLPLTREVFGFIHNDPHVNNILMEGDKLSILDFDVANYHWFINDIAVAMQGVLFTQSGGMERPLQDPAPIRRFLEHFMNGYEEEYHLDPVWLEHLDVFIAYRRMLLFTVMQEWLDTKPDVKQMWKQLILEDPAYICQQVLA
jgi:Ser/Thr protein kinase RdoA (MazF antagonist)